MRVKAKKEFPSVGDIVRSYDAFYSNNFETGEFDNNCYNEGEILRIFKPAFSDTMYYEIAIRVRVHYAFTFTYKRRKKIITAANGTPINNTSKKWFSVQTVIKERDQ